MALRRVRPRRRASITSLIDVIFLLLLFFMLASTFSKFSEIELANLPDGAPALDSTEEIQRLHIEPSRLVFNGEDLSIEEIVRRLTETRDTNGSLTVTAADEATTQQLTEVLMRLGTVPGLTIQVMEPA